MVIPIVSNRPRRPIRAGTEAIASDAEQARSAAFALLQAAENLDTANECPKVRINPGVYHHDPREPKWRMVRVPIKGTRRGSSIDVSSFGGDWRVFAHLPNLDDLTEVQVRDVIFALSKAAHLMSKLNEKDAEGQR